MHQPVMRCAAAWLFCCSFAAAGAADGPGTGGEEGLKQLSLDQLMNIEVTSVSRTEEPLFDAPASIQVVSNADIKSSGATSIPEALRLADNLEVAQENSHDWAISARGFNANLADKLLVLVDGRAVYTPLYGGVLWNVQDYPLEDIDRIEVISGPGGTQWGANAVNGVINIVSKSAQDSQGLYVSQAAGGPLLSDQTEVRYGGTAGSGVFYRVYGEFTDRGSERLLSGANADDSWNMARGGFRVDANPSGPAPITLQGDVYRGTEYLGATGDEGLYGGNLLGRWSHNSGQDSTMSVLAYVDRTHLSLPYVASPPSPPFFTGFPASALVDDLTTYNVDFQDQLGPEPGTHFVWGLSYRYTDETDTDLNLVRFLPGNLQQSLYTGFAQYQYAFAPQLRLTAGSKVEHNDYTGWEFEPSLRLAWDVAPRQMLWAAVSRAVRTPSRYDRDLFLPTGLVNAPPPLQFPTAFLQGSNHFQSETEIAWETGYRAEIGSRLTTSASLFYNAYDHLRGVAGTPTTPTYPIAFPDTFENGLRADTSGAELSADWQPLAAWRLHAGYDYLHEHVYPAPGFVDAAGGSYETGDPRHQVFLRSQIHLPGHWELDLDGRWISKLIIAESPTSGPVTGVVPAYGECDARLAWVSGAFEVSAVGQNLLHREHAEYGFPGPASELISRTAYVRVTWRY